MVQEQYELLRREPYEAVLKQLREFTDPLITNNPTEMDVFYRMFNYRIDFTLGMFCTGHLPAFCYEDLNLRVAFLENSPRLIWVKTRGNKAISRRKIQFLT